MSVSSDLPNRSWFELGGRHALDNRVSDFGPGVLSSPTTDLEAADIGCAEGDISAWLAERFRHVHGIEYMDRAFLIARERFRYDPRVSVDQADVATFPLRRRYDVVFFLGVLHYFETEALRRDILAHVLDHCRFVCYARTAMREFRVRDGRRLDMVDRYVSRGTLEAVAGDVWDLRIVDNGYRGTGERRLGDLFVYRRRCADNPFSDIDRLVAEAGPPGTIS